MNDASLSRRAFVGATGLAGSVGVLASGPSAAATSSTLRVGVLTPAGLSFTGAGDSLLAGLRLGFREAGQRVDLRREPVHLGYSGAVAAAEALVGGGAQVLVAGVSTPAAARLEDLCRDAGVALVVANSGAHVVAPPTGRPVALHSTLQHWQSSFALGRWSAARLGRSLFVVVAAPDAGFDSVFALSRAFAGAGGQLLGRAITHDGTHDAADAARAARESGADIVAIHASGARLREIVRACRRAGVRARLVVDPFALERFSPGQRQLARAKAWTAGSWDDEAPSSRAADFVEAWRRAEGGRPDAFAALGHDTATLVVEGARRVLRRGQRWETMALRMRGRRVPGVRGVQVVDRRTLTVSTPLVVRRARMRNGPDAKVVARPGRLPGDAPAMVVVARPDTSSYVNEYLGT